MCEHGDSVVLAVVVSADDSYEGVATVKAKPIDRCIASLVGALNAAGMPTRSSCCGHGKNPGEVLLHDGRTLTISQGDQ